jgi:hypothetical protein
MAALCRAAAASAPPAAKKLAPKSSRGGIQAVIRPLLFMISNVNNSSIPFLGSMNHPASGGGINPALEVQNRNPKPESQTCGSARVLAHQRNAGLAPVLRRDNTKRCPQQNL